MAINRYIAIFCYFSFLGWVWESIYCTICSKKWANRGFLYGPICPIYGSGAIIGLIIYDLIQAGYITALEWYWIFVAGFVVSMILEYPTSWILEKKFHARWWDYSDVPLNINGRTSVPTSIAFGAAAILVMEVLIPFSDRMLLGISEQILNLLALILVAVISADITLTVSELTDFQQRVDAIDGAFQNHMTDVVDQVYAVQSSIKKKAISRIAVFKLNERKSRISKQILAKNFDELIKEYYDSDVVCKMDDYLQHGETTTLEHCKNVAWISYLINEKLHLNADEKELIEAAMLHDLFLYDWHEGSPSGRKHGFAHPEIASKNAVEYFGVSDKVQAAIRSHMWPLTITELPKSKEARIICIADKYCAMIETVRMNKKFGLKK